MGKRAETTSVRVLLGQMLSHSLLFGAQNAGNLAERALLAPDPAAVTALGLSWTGFCLLSAFALNVVGVGQLIVARRTGNGDERGARAAARLTLLLAASGGALGLALAVAAGAVAFCASGLARPAALFLALQGLSLGPLLGARALTGYFAGTMRVGAGWLATVGVLPVAVHLGLALLLTCVLAWSVAGAGLARLGAALVATAAAFALARTEIRGLVGLVRRSDRALFWAMLTEGSVLGLQQVVASFMVVLLYLVAARAGDVTSAALTLTHSGIYPLLFALAWGCSQAVGAAAAQAVGRGDARDLARVTWIGLGLSAVLAFALPWGLYAAYGRPALAWLVEGGPDGGAVLAASVSFMGLLAVFFVFDFAINFLSALLRAAQEQAYLLEVTGTATAVFALLLLTLPARPDAGRLMTTFIAAQVVWSAFLLGRVVSHWPAAVSTPSCDALCSSPLSTMEQPAMNPDPTNTGVLPPALRALALGLLVETVVPVLDSSRLGRPVPSGQDGSAADGMAQLWQALRDKCGELSALVLLASEPKEAAEYVVDYLPKHIEYVFEQVYGQKRRPVLGNLSLQSRDQGSGVRSQGSGMFVDS